MDRLAWVALGSLLGLILTITLYGYYPFPAAGSAWQGPTVGISFLLVAVGMVCFLLLLVSGLILLLNWGAERRGPGPKLR